MVVVVLRLGRLGCLGGSSGVGPLAAAGDACAACLGAGPGGPAGSRGCLLPVAPLLELVGRHAADDDRDVSGALADARRSPPGAWPPALERRALVGEARRDVELVLVLLVVVHGVGRGRVEQLGDLARHGSLGVLEHGAGFVDRQAADEVEDLAGLVGRHPQELDARPGARLLVGLGDSHVYRLPRTAFSMPAWNRKVRVGANSPSLWPTIASVT